MHCFESCQLAEWAPNPLQLASLPRCTESISKMQFHWGRNAVQASPPLSAGHQMILSTCRWPGRGQFRMQSNFVLQVHQSDCYCSATFARKVLLPINTTPHPRIACALLSKLQALIKLVQLFILPCLTKRWNVGALGEIGDPNSTSWGSVCCWRLHKVGEMDVSMQYVARMHHLQCRPGLPSLGLGASIIQSFPCSCIRHEGQEAIRREA